MRFKELSLREKVYRTIILNVKRMKWDGTLKEFFDKYPAGGIYYSKGPAEGLIEIVEGEATTRQDFIKRCKEVSRFPLLICADGATIGDDGRRPSGAEALGATESKELAYDYGKALGMQMNHNGVDWIFGPSIDLSLSRHVETICPMMSDDAEYSAEMYREVVRGIQEQNVAATVKHFPGIGTHHVNMHVSAGHNTLPFDEWMETYGYLYKEMFRAGVMSVMTSHITLKSYSDRIDYGYEPVATFSKDITIGLLKERLGFDGVVVTDALYMGGSSVENQIEDAVAAFACGADLLLWPPIEAGDRIVEEIEAGRIPMSRLDDAIDRIERFMDRLGIDGGERVRPLADAKFVDSTFENVFRSGLSLVRNEYGILPLGKKDNRILIDLIAPEGKGYSAKLKAAEELRDRLRLEGFEVDLKEKFVMFIERDLKRALNDYDRVIVLIDTPFAIGFTDCFNSAWTVHLIPKEKRILLNFSSPYFIDDYYPDVKTFVQVNSPIKSEIIPALCDAILGNIQFKGKLKMNSIKI